jgi:hypothetical protein
MTQEQCHCLHVAAAGGQQQVALPLGIVGELLLYLQGGASSLPLSPALNSQAESLIMLGMDISTPGEEQVHDSTVLGAASRCTQPQRTISARMDVCSSIQKRLHCTS